VNTTGPLILDFINRIKLNQWGSSWSDTIFWPSSRIN
jgi:hypothetical protein